jgi:uncharacterized protein (TIGR00269 family)
MQKSFCTKHFIDWFERRVKRTIREYALLKGARHIGVAVSGGKDSLAALYVMTKIARPMRIKITAILIIEGIKGYREAMLPDIRRLCKQLRVPLKIYSFKKDLGIGMDQVIKKKDREVSCTYCGVFRRWIMNKAARELGIDRIVLGHNLDDVDQSFFMNLLRNEPFRLARFGAISGLVEDEAFVPRIRPFFNMPEKEVALYTVLKGFKKKFGECPYVQEAFRPLVRNFLNDLEDRYPGTKLKLFNSFLRVRETLSKEFKKKLVPVAKCSQCREPTSGVLCKRCQLLRDLNVKH